VWVGTGHAEESVQQREAELGEVRSRIQELRRELTDASTEKNAQARALQEIEERIGAVTRRMHDLEREQIIRRKRIEELAVELQAHAEEVARQRAVLAAEVRSSYVMGRQERLKLMLNQEDPALLSRMLAYYGYLHRRRVARIESVREMLRQLEAIEQAVVAEQHRLDDLIAREQDERVRLAESQRAREEILAGLESDIQVRGAEVSRLEQDERRLKDLVARLKKMQERFAAIGQIENEAAVQSAAFGDLRGKLDWPTAGRLEARFGGGKGGGLTWDGAVIGAAAGDPVRAVYRGRVVYADWLKGYGLLVILDHGGGYMSLYGYNQSLFKEAGDWVEPGDVLSVVGNSGGRRAPALYFGIRHNGKPEDPARWCRRAAGNRVGLEQTLKGNEHAG